MRTRQKFCDVSVTLPVGAFDDLAAAARSHGVAWHEAYGEIERRLRAALEETTLLIIREYEREPTSHNNRIQTDEEHPGCN